MIRSALDLIKHHEGCTLTAIKDSVGYSIGYGHNQGLVKRGDTCSQSQADAWLATDYQNAAAAAVRVCQRAGIEWPSLNEPRQATLVDMSYEMGEVGLSAFKLMLGAIKDGLWLAAAAHGLDSLWARSQAPKRAAEDMTILQSGQWPE